jgi:hypothetical protein
VKGFAPPVLAVEIVSEGTANKDYEEGPQKYAACGVRELWVFDPARLGPHLHGGPWVLQLWERSRNGRFRRTFAGDGPAWSEVMQAWLIPAGDGVHLLLSDDEAGEKVWPTEAEYGARQKRRANRQRQRAEQEKQRAEQEKQRAEQEKQRAEQEKQRAEREKQRADTERTEKLAALARVAELEALLTRRG